MRLPTPRYLVLSLIHYSPATLFFLITDRKSELSGTDSNVGRFSERTQAAHAVVCRQSRFMFHSVNPHPFHWDFRRVGRASISRNRRP